MAQIPENKRQRPILIENFCELRPSAVLAFWSASFAFVAAACQAGVPRLALHRGRGTAIGEKLPGLVPRRPDTGFAACVLLDVAAARLAVWQKNRPPRHSRCSTPPRTASHPASRLAIKRDPESSG